MRTLDAISLNSDWCYLFETNQRSDFSDPAIDDHTWIPLPMLDDWAVCSSSRFGADWFRREVVVDEINDYLDYVLVISKVPESVALYVNGQHVGNVKGNKGFCENVTPFLNDGENLIAMKLTCSLRQGGGVFGDIHLQPVPRKPEGASPISGY